MTRILTAALSVALAASATAADPESAKYLKAFPAAEEGVSKFVIQLPHKTRQEEGDFRVELIVGKEVETDGVNRVFAGGTIEDKPLKGWGFTYYRVEKFGPLGSTLIGVPPGTPKVKKFVSMTPKLIRYNSRVPVVVYVPDGVEVRYRVWSASEKTEKAEKK